MHQSITAYSGLTRLLLISCLLLIPARAFAQTAVGAAHWRVEAGSGNMRYLGGLQDIGLSFIVPAWATLLAGEQGLSLALYSNQNQTSTPTNSRQPVFQLMLPAHAIVTIGRLVASPSASAEFLIIAARGDLLVSRQANHAGPLPSLSIAYGDRALELLRGELYLEQRGEIWSLQARYPGSLIKPIGGAFLETHDFPMALSPSSMVQSAGQEAFLSASLGEAIEWLEAGFADNGPHSWLSVGLALAQADMADADSVAVSFDRLGARTMVRLREQLRYQLQLVFAQ